jgi:hypothetical protein
MAIHIHIYGGDSLRPRQRPTVLESASERRRREASEDAERSRRITDRGGIDGTVRRSDRIGP